MAPPNLFQLSAAFALLACEFAMQVAGQNSTSEEDVPLTIRATGYIPALGWVIAGIVAFGLAGLSLTCQFFRYKTYWAWILPLTVAWECAGFFVRIAVRNSPDSMGTYIGMSSSILLAPAGFLAFNYITYGRLARSFVPLEWTLINPRRVGVIFVLSDVITFLVQCAGSGMTASANESSANLGEKILLVGLILQAVSYVFFIMQAVFLHRRVVLNTSARRNDISAHNPSEMVEDGRLLRKVLWVLHFSGLFILIRCIYRIIEGAQGREGVLITHEIYFMLLDSLPLCIAVGCWIPFWPGQYIPRTLARGDYEKDWAELQGRGSVTKS